MIGCYAINEQEPETRTALFLNNRNRIEYVFDITLLIFCCFHEVMYILTQLIKFLRSAKIRESRYKNKYKIASADETKSTTNADKPL